MAARILIVEDEQITAEDLRDILTDLGYTVVDVVATGLEAIARAEATKPDLALMDIRIKGNMDGTETARVLRERFNIPVIYLTAHADTETVNRAKVAEPLGYITKPFQEGELHASIEIALHKHGEDVKAKKREEVLAGTLRAIGQGVISVDAAGTIVLLNDAAAAWTGWNAEDAAGRPLQEALSTIDADSRARVEVPLAEAMASGELKELDNNVLLRNRNGDLRPIEGSIAPIRDHHGQVSGAVIVFGAAAGSRPSSQREAQPKEEELGFGGFKMVAASPAMKQVVKFARRVAESEASTILLEGESGTGKDVMAQFMHHFGKRHNAPFVPLNCAAIPETLLESELFGYEKGAFTDARAPKAGILEIASGGTVFLDEIGEMPVVLQAKMLRVLEEQTFRRLGGVRDIHVDLRIMAATNRKLADAIEEGKFRLDLYYRLNVIQVVLPSLRERKDDILPLSHFFIQMFNQRFKRNITGISRSAEAAMLAYEWPGNVRELRNTMERAMVLEETDLIQPASLRLDLNGMEFEPSLETRPDPGASHFGGSLEEAEKNMLIQALDKAAWNQTRAAVLLGISRDTLRYKMKKHSLRRSSDFPDQAGA
jgi:PAS domain S-box-containing protein